MGVPVFAERNRDDILSFIELCKLSHGGEVRPLCQWHNAAGWTRAMDSELDARYRDVSLKDALRRVLMDMTLDGWVFIRVARQCLSKIKGYPYEVDSGDDTLLNARCKKGLPKWIALFLRMGAWRCSTLTWGDPTLPSTLTCFTSEFGMDSGGTTSLLPPGINFL